MHHIFPDHAVVRRECDIFLAVSGWPARLEATNHWIADAHPETDVEMTRFDYLPFGPLAAIVFDNYDVILQIRFPMEDGAQNFEALWPTPGLAAGPYASLWPDRSPTPLTLVPFRPELLRRIAEMKKRRKKASNDSDPA